MDYIASWELVTLEARITQINKGMDVDRLSKAAQEIDRYDLTKAGRGLQKHGSRPDAAFPKATGNVAQVNAQGQYEVDNILTFPGHDIYFTYTRSSGLTRYIYICQMEEE